jgi:branched-chain amino acid aminotransferase
MATSQTPETYYIDGRFVAAPDAMIPVNDLALLRGFGVFELVRTCGGRPFLLEEHLERLENSARRIDLALPWTRRSLRRIVLETLARNHLPEANLRIVVTGGPSTDFMTPQGSPRLLVLVSPLPSPPPEWYSRGVKIILLVTEREVTDAKSTNYLTATLAQREAARSGAVEAVYVSREGLVQEGTTSNLFLFAGGQLATPGRGVLPGITRQTILHLAQDLFPVQIRDITRSELLNAAEIFISGTNKGIVPVVEVDGQPIGDGRPGPCTRRLMDALRAYMETRSDKGHTP